MKKILKIETVHQCNCCLGNKTLHPLVSVIDLAKSSLTEDSLKFSFYTILLIENECDEYMYGRESYDYCNATLIFLPPGHSIQVDKKKPFPCKGRLLAFHPHLICGTALGMNIDNYTFFSYNREEALHLSLREKNKAIECLNNIDRELQHTIDRHSKILIARYIELLLDYCSRYYERQFITRCDVNKQILHRLELLLDDYIQCGKLKSKTLPSTKYCSDALSLSASYFNDLLKFETGQSLSDYFQLKRIEVAKKMLLCKDNEIELRVSNDIHLIAEELGFPNEQYFRKLFQRITGGTPEEYRCTKKYH